MAALQEACDMTSDKEALAAGGIRVIPPLRNQGMNAMEVMAREMCLTGK